MIEVERHIPGPTVRHKPLKCKIHISMVRSLCDYKLFLKMYHPPRLR